MFGPEFCQVYSTYSIDCVFNEFRCNTPPHGGYEEKKQKYQLNSQGLLFVCLLACLFIFLNVQIFYFLAFIIGQQYYQMCTSVFLHENRNRLLIHVFIID